MGILSTSAFIARTEQEKELVAFIQILLRLNSSMSKIVGFAKSTYVPEVNLQESIKSAIRVIDSEVSSEIPPAFYSMNSVGKIQRVEALKEELSSIINLLDIEASS